MRSSLTKIIVFFSKKYASFDRFRKAHVNLLSEPFMVYSRYAKAYKRRQQFDYKAFKKKSHKHHIIPYYSFRTLNIPGNNVLSVIVRGVDKVLTYVPFYFSVSISLAGVFLLLFIFIFNYETITALDFSKPYLSLLIIKIYAPKFPKQFLLFYASFFFYLIVLLHSVFKFFVYVFDEVRSHHIYTSKVEQQCLFGVILFILSETMLFVAFFWAFFSSSLTPSIFIGNCWPPVGITTLNPWHIPFLNTCILLTSGVTVNWFFYTLKRLSYFTARHSTNIKYHPYSQPMSFIYHTAFNFLFVDFQRIELVIKFRNKKSVHTFLLTVFAPYRWLMALNIIVFTFFKVLVRKYASVKKYHFKKKKTSNNTSTILCSINTNKKANKSKKFLIFLNTQFKVYFTSVMYPIVFFMNFFKTQFVEFKHVFLSLLDNVYLDKLYIKRSFTDMYLSLLLTIYLGVMFLCFQFCEYEYYATFSIDNIYGTVFYSLTLLHGSHVFVGIFSLTMCFTYFNSFKFYKADMNKGVFINFWIIFSVWYWHFVDVIWLFLFIIVYIWGS